MIPRLAPRPSRRRSSTSLEHVDPFSPANLDLQVEAVPMADPDETYLSLPLPQEMRPPSPQPPPLEVHNPGLHSRRQALSDLGSSLNAPQSPSPTATLLDPFKSPLSVDDSSCSDCSLTPPVTGPQPLVVSAKRVGQDVRRKHSKRRRCRSRNKNNNGFCLWEDKDAPARPVEESSDDEDDSEEGLSLKEMSEREKTQHYWEWCYGKSTPNMPTNPGWSAKRAPPARSCLSTKEVPATSKVSNSFKTPPASPEDVLTTDTVPGTKKRVRVQFGVPQAAEYDIDGPTGQMTPLPSDLTRRRYSMDAKQLTETEEEMTQETKENTAMLAEWEEEFDQPAPSRSRSRRRKDRRSSSLFSPSPIVLAKEETAEETPLKDSQSLSTPSPSAEVTRELACLRMGSPAVDCTETSLPVPPNSQTEDPSSVSQTMEFAVDLQSVNAIGGAMDVSPLRTDTHNPAIPANKLDAPSASNSDTSPPPAGLNLDTIHSLGGALGDSWTETVQGPAHNGHSPISRLSDTSDRPSLAASESNNLAVHVDVVKSILRKPGVDQEWEPSVVLRNLVGKEQTGTMSMAMQYPSHDAVQSCLGDLIERASFCANTKSNTKFKLPAKEAPHARRLVGREWKQLEVEFLNDVCEALGRTADKNDILLKKAEISKPRGRRRMLELEIASLQKKVSSIHERRRYEEAVQAPMSALLCQASSHVGICGFRLDGYNGESLQLSYEHVVQGVECCFSFDLNTGAVACSRIANSLVSKGQIPSDHVAARFHEHLLTSMINTQETSLRNLDSTCLQETVMSISRWLGAIDMATKDLELAASGDVSVSVDMPIVTLTSNSDREWSTRLFYNKVVFTGLLLPSQVLLARPDQQEEKLAIPSTATSSNCIQMLVELNNVW